MVKKIDKRVLKMKQIIKEVPFGVKFISVLVYINAVLSLLFGLFLLFASDFLLQYMKNMSNISFFNIFGSFSLIVLGVVGILFSILDFSIARGLWKGQNWARILVIFFSIIGILFSLLSINIMGLVIYGLVFGYFGYSIEVKKAFL